MTRVLVTVYPESDASEPPDYDRLTLVSLDEADFVRQGFDPIARDGARTVEVLIRMQKLLSVIAECSGDRVAHIAKIQGATAMQWAEHELVLDQHKEAVRQVFESLFDDDRLGKIPAQ